MNYQTCDHCNGSGYEANIFKGYWPNGEECWEPIRCTKCDGFGHIDVSDYNIILGEN